MTRALFIVDVQNDFTERGALGVEGGDAVAERISRYLAEHADDYALIVASRDWHHGDDDNGGHFSEAPDFVDTWPVHCVGGTFGADYDEVFDTARVTHHLKKGQGKPAYSLFEGVTDEGETAAQLLEAHGIRDIDVVGIATDYCVRASALDALGAGRRVRVLIDLIAGVHPDSSAAALTEIETAGAQLATSGD
ncbi:isochorismatase family protein [Microbacterium sp. 20-116]|uniref:isochorismatase family protein n=1 Tax=unclassified Microbacterium TaxID=2609290 RepID=UPI00226E253A|nr:MULTISPECIES: isochorismatase family protein [unclassified Microbacterium]MDQ1175374.1 nicotinamidase/pyrazinamidase [Microbacterium sp. SORGH_AS_0421]WAC69375.1 isochorismatase family protein [Microbacterium sp. SL75]